jgi:hypothetical protein
MTQTPDQTVCVPNHTMFTPECLVNEDHVHEDRGKKKKRRMHERETH